MFPDQRCAVGCDWISRLKSKLAQFIACQMLCMLRLGFIEQLALEAYGYISQSPQILPASRLSGTLSAWEHQNSLSNEIVAFMHMQI